MLALSLYGFILRMKVHYEKGNPNMKNTDLTFITNEEQKNLKARFRVLIKDTKFFDCLVGYFYTSGFHAVYKSLENTEKIRILIGISTSKLTYDLLTKATQNSQQSMQFSHDVIAYTLRNLNSRLYYV